MGAPGADTMTNGSEGEAAGLGPWMCPAAPGSTRLKGRNVSWWSHEKPLVSRTLPSPSHGASDMLGETFPTALGLCMLRGLGGAQGRRPGACWWEASQECPLSRAIPGEGSPDLQDPTLRPPRVWETQVCPESAGALLNPEHRVSVGSRATWPHHRVNVSEPRGPGDMPGDHGQSACQASTEEERSADLCLPHGAPLCRARVLNRDRESDTARLRRSPRSGIFQRGSRSLLPSQDSLGVAWAGGQARALAATFPEQGRPVPLVGSSRGRQPRSAAASLLGYSEDTVMSVTKVRAVRRVTQPGRKPSVWAVRRCRGWAACALPVPQSEQGRGEK